MQKVYVVATGSDYADFHSCALNGNQGIAVFSSRELAERYREVHKHWKYGSDFSEVIEVELNGVVEWIQEREAECA